MCGIVGYNGNQQAETVTILSSLNKSSTKR